VRPARALAGGLALAAPLCAALALRAFAFEPFEVVSDSMLPTLVSGDRLLVNKLAAPRRGDVVVFERGSEHFVKRVVGLPGERVEVRGPHLRVNGVEADAWPTGTLRFDGAGRTLGGERERLGEVEHDVLDDLAAGRRAGVFEVPPDHYFVLGDNRDHSADSRDYGAIASAEIIGVATRGPFGPRNEAERPDGE
jgi:signal peptidase I